jgi:hypothetical protein
MEDLFGNLYCWFESLFGQSLADHLWGYSCETLSYSNSNAFYGIGVITFAISLIMAITYYYVINHPRFNRWWSWLIMLGITGIVCLFVGYQWTATDFINGYIGDCLMHVRDTDGNILSYLISENDCWMFGVSNLIVSFGFFLLFSGIILLLGRLVPQIASRNSKYSPI